jgi:hypothetical protein
MRPYAALVFPLLLALPAAAETVLSEASGTWTGPSDQSVSFLARLTQEEDVSRLRIWSGTADAPPTGDGDPDFDNGQIALAAFATLQALEVAETDGGQTLQVVTEFADEEAEGRVVLSIQLVDARYTVRGFHYKETARGDGGTPYECIVDFVNGSVIEDGLEYAMAVDSGVTSAADWTYATAFERRICSVN